SRAPGRGQGARPAAGRAPYLGGVPPGGARGDAGRRGGRRGPHASSHGLRGQEQGAEDAPGRNPETRSRLVISWAMAAAVARRWLAATALSRPAQRGVRLPPQRPRSNRLPSCPSDETLAGLLADALTAAERDSLARHLDGCAPCQEKLARLTRTPDTKMWRRAGHPPQGPEAEEGVVRRLKRAPPSWAASRLGQADRPA